MFGGKFKTWMEAHIGRPRKKQKETKPDKIFQESSESLAHSDTGISSGSLQVLSSTTDGRDSYCNTTIESGCGVAHSRTVNLSSPESAYSTGYSTDGASPGDALHPEYYINIRTGKHYFPSPAPTPTSPNPHPHPRTCMTTSFLSAEPRIPPLTTFPSWLAEPIPLADSRPSFKPPYHRAPKSPKKTPPKSPLSSLKNFLKSPKQDKVKPQTLAFDNAKKTRKWYKQPFKFSNKLEVKQEEKKPEVHKEAVYEKIQYPVTCEATASPRQRNRIRTNPWIPKEPLSTAHLQLNFPPNFLRNRSCTNTPLQQRRTPDDPPLHDRLQQLTIQYENSRDYLSKLKQKLAIEMSDPSEEDLTLNEMMGTFTESYVYEKETDILSDSDPTDCEDYISDSEANHGGDEDSHDDELDFIDTGSYIAEDDGQANTGRCSYHEVCAKKTAFLYRRQNSLDAENRRNSRKEKEAKKRKREEKKRRSLRKLEQPEPHQPARTISLRKVLLQKMLDKNCSKSAESSPIGLRRKKSSLRETHIGSPSRFELSVLADAEADKKYNELILEAETMLESLKNTPVAQKRQPPTLPPQKPKNLGLKLAVKNEKTSFRAKSSAHSPLDPLGPTFRTFSVFKEPPKKISSSSSDDSETVLSRPPPIPALPFGFQFVDLGRPTTSHCPQSEPVKRKMYTYSKTFDRLVRTFDTPSSPRPRRPVPAFYNPMYSPNPVLPTTHLGRRSSGGPLSTT